MRRESLADDNSQAVGAAPLSLTSPAPSSPTEALVLAFLASSSSSLLAAQCLVESVLELYLAGHSFTSIQMDLALSTAARAGGSEPLDQDTLTAWVALVMLTLEEMGVAREPEHAAGSGSTAAAAAVAASAAGGGGLSPLPEQARFLQGMRGYVRQTLSMQAKGVTLQRLRGLQGLIGSSGGGGGGLEGGALEGGPSGAQAVMQQYTRLVLLTAEVVEVLRLPRTPAAAPSAAAQQQQASGDSGPAGAGPEEQDSEPGPSAPLSVSAPTGYTFAFHASPADSALGRTLAARASSSPSSPLRSSDPQLQAVAGLATAPLGLPSPLRAQSLRLLICFIGAVLGSHASLQRFVHTTCTAYCQGLSASELFDQLHDDDFLQSGGLVPVSMPSTRTSLSEPGDAAAAAAQPVPVELLRQDVNKQLFSTWLSITFLALAQLGLPYPGASRKLGWAWAGFGDAVEALGVESFVRGALHGAERARRQRRRQQEGQQGEGQDGDAGVGVDGGPQGVAPAASFGGQVALEVSGSDGGIGGLGSGEEQGVGDVGPGEDTVARWLAQKPELQQLLEADREAAALAFIRENKLRGRPAPVLVRVEDEGLAASSSALKVLAQEAALVEEALGLAASLANLGSLT